MGPVDGCHRRPGRLLRDQASFPVLDALLHVLWSHHVYRHPLYVSLAPAFRLGRSHFSLTFSSLSPRTQSCCHAPAQECPQHSVSFMFSDLSTFLTFKSICPLSGTLWLSELPIQIQYYQLELFCNPLTIVN